MAIEVKGEVSQVEAVLWAVRLETDATGAQLDTLERLIKALAAAGAQGFTVTVQGCES